jgi:hypothetical protein
MAKEGKEALLNSGFSQSLLEFSLLWQSDYVWKLFKSIYDI